MTPDIFSTIINMTTFSSFIISLPFLLAIYTNLFYFIMFHEGSKLLNPSGDSDIDSDSDKEPDTPVSCSIKFNKDYENKYMDKFNAATASAYGDLNTPEDVDKTIKLEQLLNSYILENTPLGNVVMRYNFNIEAFEFFSDNAIPYRYLETVSRKYVLTHKCLFLYVDMAQTLKDSETKMVDQKEKEKEKENEKDLTNKPDSKKNVFANLKDYNKPSFSGSVKNAPPPKNNISNVRINNTNAADIILKEKSNRYSCQGKLVNFSFLKKVDKKLVNKKLGISFADFKYMDVNNTKIVK